MPAIADRPPLTAAQVADFNRDGYLLVPGLLAPAETDLLLATAKADQVMLEAAVGVADAAGRTSKLSLWNHPGDDIYGMVARSNRIVTPMEQVLGGEVYHYHSKMMLKEPRVGGAWEWHQDYGYWYNNGCLFPLMASCLIAVDRASKANGCLQVLRGSHLMGRVEHGRFGGQTGADPERVKEAMKRLELVHCEMEPGSGLFFHGNLLHSSAPNTSPDSRWSLICCYNAARNDPYKESHHPRYTPLKKVADAAILEAGAKGMDERVAFMKPEADRTTAAKKV
ncbi:MAG: phytanoyl-CoA dioxygenase family protein [Planctomycetota bacterium]|nr:phytanoyl-CoA dioxygenase family protein [Planctomycetota bacterium]